MSERTDFPSGWIWTNLSEITVKKVEQTKPEGDTFSYIDIGSVDRETKTVGMIEPQPCSGAPSRARQKVRAGDVLVSMTRPNLNAVAKVPQHLEDAIASTGFDVLRPIIVEPDWIYSHVRSRAFVSEMTELVQGALYPAVKSGDVRGSQLPLPPLNEQKRIVSKIEALQGHSSRAREALEAVGPLLEKFRQSVLASAFRGDLTKEWRQQNPDVEPAEVLLARIREERRTRWIEAAAEKGRARAEAKAAKANKPWTAADDKKVLTKEMAKAEKKYTEPEPPDTSELPELPEGWCWATLEELADPAQAISYGVLKPGPFTEGGIPMLRIIDIRGSKIALDSAHLIPEDLSFRYQRTILQGGEVLISVVGTIGLVAYVPDFCEGVNVHRNLAVVAPMSFYNGQLLSFCLSSPFIQKQIRELTTGANQPLLNLGDIKKICIPVPPVEEQESLLTKCLALTNAASEQKSSQSSMVGLLQKMEQSILAKAFRGELVPQDPNDEPASVLLERIKAEREAAAPKKKKKTTRRKKAKS